MTVNKGEQMKKNRLMNFGEIGDSVFFRLACDCMRADCDMELELEFEPEFSMIYLNMTKELHASAHWGYTDKWYYFDFIRVFINKIRMMCRILFFGYIEVSETLIFRDSKHIDEFLTALEEGRRYLVNFEEALKAKSLVETERKK